MAKGVEVDFYDFGGSTLLRFSGDFGDDYRFGIVLLGAGFFCMILPLRRLRCVTFTRGYPGRRMNLRIFLSAWHDSFLHCNCAGHQCMNDI